MRMPPLSASFWISASISVPFRPVSFPPRGNDYDAFNPGPHAFTDDEGYRLYGGGNDRKVNRLPHVSDRRIGREAAYYRVPGVNGKDFSLIPTLLNIPDQSMSNTALFVTGTNHCYSTGLKILSKL